MNEAEPNEALSDAVAQGGDHGSSTSDEAPRKKRRRRRGGRGRGAGTEPGREGVADTVEHRVKPDAVAPHADAAALASLTAGLFSHLDDREVPCKFDGCDRTWTWTAADQIQSFGQPPPKRACREHNALLHSLADRPVPCSTPGCEHTWLWTKAAQLAQLQRGELGSPPLRVCDSCAKRSRDAADQEVPCRVDGCNRTWVWTRDAQLKHQAWLRHTAGETRAPASEKTEGGRRRKRRRQRRVDGPPARMCEPCRERQGTLVDRESTCKVHGCTRTVTIDRESQLRAWAALHTTDLTAEAPVVRRMCEVCREFCRLHGDREVACGRPGCDRTWTYKTGAQLQAFLAGRFEDPLRLCEQCLESAVAEGDGALLEDGAEVMPCIVPGCDGTWHYLPGTSLAPAQDGDLPPDRMCARCRQSSEGATEPPN